MVEIYTGAGQVPLPIRSLLRRKNISCSQRKFNRISRLILMKDLRLWGQNVHIEYPNFSRNNMLSLIIAAVLMATIDAKNSSYCLICDNHTICKYPGLVRT